MLFNRTYAAACKKKLQSINTVISTSFFPTILLETILSSEKINAYHYDYSNICLKIKCE